ncbi:MAG: ferredoxin family protein [Planctomycetota bacterium]|nr:ferredoxin family protein [Planctomycetota bacterium]
MALVVTSPCIGTKDAACTKVCPCSCFYDAGEMLVIRPDECIDCGLCIPECPVAAIFHRDEVPEAERAFIERNARFFEGKAEAELEALRVVS